MGAAKKLFIFAIIVLLLALLIWPKETEPESEECSCLGLETAEYCYGLLSSCDYIVPETTLQEERQLVRKKSFDADIALVIDTSQSMRGVSLDEAKASAKSLVEKLTEGDRAAIVRFDDKAELMQRLTSDSRVLATQIDALDARGRTQYLPALTLAYEEFLKEGLKENIFIMIFISDGQPDDDTQEIMDMVTTITQSGICMHTIGYGSAILEGSQAESILKDSASLSQQFNGCGSYNYAPSGAETLQTILSDIYDDVVMGPRLLVELDEPMNMTYSESSVPFKLLLSASASCTYILNNGNEQTIESYEFQLDAKPGENLLVVDCEGIILARKFAVERDWNLLRRFSASIETGDIIDISEEERRKVILKVLSEENASPELLSTIEARARETSDSIVVKKDVKSGNGKTTVTATLSPQASMKDIDIYMDIPKCMAEKLNELVFYDQNFRVIADDPLIVWHFNSVSESVDFSIEILKEIEDYCNDQLSIIPVAGNIGERKGGLLLKNLLPLLLIPIILGLVVFSKELNIDDASDKKQGKWLFIAIILLLILAYPKDMQSDDDGLYKTCDCAGYSSFDKCYGIIKDCTLTDKMTKSAPVCEPTHCGVIEDYLIVNDRGTRDFIELDMTIVLDRSRSMKGERMEQAKAAVKNLIGIMGVDDRAAIVRFDDSAQLIQQFTSDKNIAKAAVDSIEVGQTTQYIPAIDVALSNYKSFGSDRKKLLIFVSDGEPDDQGRPYSIFSEVEHLAEQDICLHTVGYGSAISPGSQAETVLKGMARISYELTGCGEYHYAPQDQALLQEIFTSIYNDIILAGSLDIDAIATLDQKSDAIVIFANVTSAFNGRSIPGVGELACSGPAKLSVDIITDGITAKSTDFVYDYDLDTYRARVSDIMKGDYQAFIRAQSMLKNGSTCIFSGQEKFNLELEKSIGFVGCDIDTCGDVGDYLAYSKDFVTDITVNITDSSFDPASIKVSDGTTVKWVNIGKKNHSVSSVLFSSGPLMPGESYQHTFSTAGSVEYFDNIQSLQGTVDTEIREEYAFGLNQSVDVILAVDTSGSMSGGKLDEAINASRRLVQMLYRNDRAAVLQFDDEVRFSHAFSGNKESLSNSITKLIARGGTEYIEPLEAAKYHFEQFGRSESKKMMIFLSDGQPWDASAEEIIAKVKELVDSGICVYTVGYGDEVTKGGAAEMILRSMADISKTDKRCGEYYYSVRSAARLSTIFGEIYKEIITLESLDMNVTMPEILNDNETVIISVGLNSRYNDNPVPGFSDDGRCIPPARVQANIKDIRGRAVQSLPLEYEDGLYTAKLQGLTPGIYDVNIDAVAMTGGFKSCNFYGSEERRILVTTLSEERGFGFKAFNLLVIIVVVGSIAYLAVRMSRRKTN